MNYDKAPKIELHLHLDCSLSYAVVQKLDPGISKEEYDKSFIAPPKCSDLADYLSRAVKGFQLMQSRESMRLVTLDLFDQLKKDNVIYAEIRFAPLLHTYEELTAEQVVEAVNEAVTEGIKLSGIEAGIILCTLRHHNEEQSMETVQLVNQFKGTHVVGFDIAGDEAGFPIDNHIKAFEFAIANDLNCTAHAGEAKGAASVWETINHFHPSRIGHGARSAEDEALLHYLKNEDIHLEVCPTSNVQTNVIDTMEHHPIDKIFHTGISMSVNTDARTISNVTLANEYDKLKGVFGWNKVHFKTCNLAAIDHAFTSLAIKMKLRQQIIEAYK